MYGADGVLLAAEALYYGEQAPTNNTSEAQAMVDGLHLLGRVPWGDSEGVLVTGDSKLTIQFMHRTARPGKRELVQAVQEARNILARWRGKRVHFRHVPRDQNQ